MKPPFGSVIVMLLLSFSAAAQTNEWTKPTSGYWEESYWSLGRLPGIDQQLVAINNDGWKAVAIGANTTASYPQSLSLRNLLIDAPTNSSNQLLLNWAGLSVPLLVHSNLTIGIHGSLVSHYSALVVSNAYIDGSVWFMDYATENFGQLWLRSGATVGLTNGIMTCSNVNFLTGTFTQSGGTHLVQNLEVPHYITNYVPQSFPTCAYYLQGGTLVSQHLPVGFVGQPVQNPGGFPEADFRDGSFWQTGGVHTNSEMDLPGFAFREGDFSAGHYRLDGGLLVSTSVNVDDGNFSQNGGTNFIQELRATGCGNGCPSSYFHGFQLSGGQLVTSNVLTGAFLQTGGNHTVLNRLQSWDYHLTGGSLLVSDLEIINGGHLIVSSNAYLVSGNISLAGDLGVFFPGTVSNAGIVSVSGDRPSGDSDLPAISANGPGTQYLGQLKILTNCVLFYSDGATVRFADSHTLPWSGSLTIAYWGTNPDDHIFFGTNAHGLTTAQLAQVTLYETNGASYSAALLPTGELVPGVPPLSVTNSGSALVVSWPGTGYELFCSTNVSGPYSAIPTATSPFTNTFTDSQRFFRLQLLSP